MPLMRRFSAYGLLFSAYLEWTVLANFSIESVIRSSEFRCASIAPPARCGRDLRLDQLETSRPRRRDFSTSPAVVSYPSRIDQEPRNRYAPRFRDVAVSDRGQGPAEA